MDLRQRSRISLQRGGTGESSIFFCKNLFTASATEAAEKPHGRTAGPDSGRPSALIDLTSPQGESRDEMGRCDGLLMNLVPLLRLH